MAEPTKRLNVLIPAQVMRNVKIVAVERDATIAETAAWLLERAIADYAQNGSRDG